MLAVAQHLKSVGHDVTFHTSENFRGKMESSGVRFVTMHFFVDCMYLLPDMFLQFTAEAFEYPRSDMPETVRFIGPILPSRTVEFEEPAWWPELDGSRPVVLITQGTLANHDLNEVIQPAFPHGEQQRRALVHHEPQPNPASRSLRPRVPTDECKLPPLFPEEIC
jgi:UDP:flavonoid glycosyltransferase YjiC (YdhE family)